MAESTENPAPIAGATPWTAGGIAFLILLAVFCAILIQNAYHREDVYFSDLGFETLVAGQHDVVMNGSVALEDKPPMMQIHLTFYPRGLGVSTPSEIELRALPPGYRYFAAEIGVDAQALPGGPAAVIFTVLGDGTVLYESPPLRSGMEPRLVFVPIEGRQTLTLRAVCEENREGVPANWAMARFVHR